MSTAGLAWKSLEAFQECSSRLRTNKSCRKPTSIPPEGVAALESAFYINHLFDIRDTLMGATNQEGASQQPHPNATPPNSPETKENGEEGEGDDKMAPPFSNKSSSRCPEHQNNELQLYCETCSEIICYECTIEKHHGHKYDTTAKVAEECRKELLPLLDPVEKGLAETEGALTQLGSRREEMQDRHDSIRAEVLEVAERLHQAVDARKDALLEELETVTREKLKALAGEKDLKETLHTKLGGCLRQVRQAVSDKSHVELLTAEDKLKRSVEEVMEDFREEGQMQGIEADMRLSLPPDLLQNAGKFGRILTPASADPLRCTAQGQGLELASVGERANIHLKVLNHRGQPCQELLRHLECVLVYEGGGGEGEAKEGNREECDVEALSPSLFQIGYTPTVEGRHQLHIRVEGRHIVGSPFPVSTKRPMEKLGVPSLVVSLSKPWGVCVNSKGEVLVSESGAGQIAVLNACGARLRTIGSQGSDRGELSEPRGLALDGDGNIYVVDSANHRVQKFSQNGCYLASGGNKGTSPTQFQDPKGVAFSTANGQLYVADCHRVQVLNPNLTFSGSFGKKGRGEGEFESAFSVACDALGNVYVGDNRKTGIQIFSPVGQYVGALASHTSPQLRVLRGIWGTTGIYSPVGLAVDSCGLVYVSDDVGSHVTVLTPQGERKASFGRDGYSPGEFKVPRGVAVKSTGEVYVCDYKNSRLQVF